MAQYQAALGHYNDIYSQCAVKADQNTPCGSANLPNRPTAPIPSPAAKPGQQPAPAKGGAAPAPAPPPVVLTPQQIAEIAVAQLTVPTVKPEIGPPPEVNKWKMAVVGYPLWLSPGGDTRLGPIAQTVGGQSVALDASLASVSYRMGDGHLVSCPGGGTPWTPSVPPGTPSPDCGYRYTEPSLPNGKYTVTAIATWNVNWTINDATGVIPIYTNASQQLPVGELQALVR